MSDTHPTPAPAAAAPVPYQDIFTQRVTTLTAAAAFLAGAGALIWVMIFGDPQIASIAMGFVGGTLVGSGGSYFMRGRVENPTQTRTGTGDGGGGTGASVAVQNADVVNANQPAPAKPVAPGTTTSSGAGGSVALRPPTGGGMP